MMDVQYNYSATQNNGRITGSVDGVTGENVSYTYDALNRLSGAVASGMWSASYSYDGFGNLTGKSGTGGAPNMTATYDGANHQTGVSYDANGNVLGDGTATYTWDVENRMVGRVSGTSPNTVTSTYWYDPWGRRVNLFRADNSSGTEVDTHEYYFYGITGQKLMTVGCSYGQDGTPTCAVTGQNVYFGGKLLVSGGVAVATDRLGSVRANGQGEKFSYYPYGEERTTTVDGREKFGTYFRDVGTGLDYAEQRYYSSGTGSFFSPDPSGASAADPGNPNSWNMYAYAGGDPINFNDPDGLATSDCGDSWFSYNGQVIGTVSDALYKLGTNVTDLAETEYTESRHDPGVNSTAEEDMIGEVIMNRWALVNGYWYLYPYPHQPPQDTSIWGTTGGIANIVQAYRQFDVWSGSSLTDSAQSNLDHALNSKFDSKECNGLAWAIGSAIGFISSPTVNIYYDKATGLAPLAFNSGNLTIPSYMGKIGSFGDANVFYGAPVGEFSANLIPLPRPRPIRPPKPPRKPGPPRGGPRMVQ